MPFLPPICRLYHHRCVIRNPLFSQVEQPLQLGHGDIRVGGGVADRARVAIYLVIIVALVGAVAEEVDGGVLDVARLLGLVLQVLQAVGRVPAGRDYVKGDLAADRESVAPYVSGLKP